MKTLDVEGIGIVSIVERAHTRRLVLRVQSDGTLRVSAPIRTPKRVITRFILEKKDWIDDQRISRRPLKSGDLIAHKFELYFEPSAIASPKARLVANNLTISYPSSLNPGSAEVQLVAAKKIKKILKNEAENYLVARLRYLSQLHSLDIGAISIKQLKSRWGSCTSEKNINLNAQLMNLPHHLIDHVLLHELSHTIHMNHSAKFWELLENLDENCQNHKKQLKSFDATSLVMA